MLQQLASGPNKTENYIYQLFEVGYFMDKINYWTDFLQDSVHLMSKKKRQEYLSRADQRA